MFDNLPLASPAAPVQPPARPSAPSTNTTASTPASSAAPAQDTVGGPAPSSASPVSLSADKVTVMPQRFFVPPKNPTPWGKIVVGIVVVLVVGGGIVAASMYVKSRIQPPTETTPPVKTATVEPPVTPEVTPPPPPATSNAVLLPPPVATTDTPVIPPASPDTVVPPPPPNPPLQTEKVASTADTDGDGLTDVEEKLYGTDVTQADTNHNGFADGRELVNLYSPTEAKNNRLWETAVVNRYEQPEAKYQILYPSAWLARPTDSSAREVLFTSSTGEFVSIVVDSNPSNQSPRDWYAAQAPGVDVSTLEAVKTASGLVGIKSPNSSTVYIALPGSQPTMVTLNYNVGVLNAASFWSTVGMMINSLQLAQSPVWPFASTPTPPANVPPQTKP